MLVKFEVLNYCVRKAVDKIRGVFAPTTLEVSVFSNQRFVAIV